MTLRRATAAAVLVALVAACSGGDAAAPATLAPTSPITAATTVQTTTVTTSTVTTSTAPVSAPASSSAPPTTSIATTTSITTTTASTTAAELAPARYDALTIAAFELITDNLAVSVSVHRPGTEPWGLAAGWRNDGEPTTTDTPFVIASVSKLVTALSIARLVERGELTVDDRVPWDAMGVAHDPAWDDVTVRELLDHTSGMPINRKSWLDDPGSCSVPLAEAMALPPELTRGEWTYSNGNYCALGLLVEQLTGGSLDDAAYELVFEPAGIDGPYLSIDGTNADAAPYAKGLARLSRLGGAGSWLMSTDDLVTMLDHVTVDDLRVLRSPGIIEDQYGWGHTGTLDGAKACAWVLDDGTTVAAVVSGSRPATGGDVCDTVVVALATDLGSTAGDPVRFPL
jgi:D-alanyl-D-alanine carboxypeptidase